MAPQAFKKISESITFAPQIDVDISRGLTQEDVEQRKSLKLTNKTQKHVSRSYPRIIFDNLFNVLNIILLLVFLLMVYAQLTLSHYFFMIILVANITIGLIQDIHSRRLTDKLKVLAAAKIKVLRNGVIMEIESDAIVLSDIVLLSAGDQIPADSEIVEGVCRVDESLISGESVPIGKGVGDMLLSGSFLTKGNVKVEVKRVGSANYAEQLQASAKKFSQPKSEIKSSTNIIMSVCAIFCVVMGLAQFAIFFANEMSHGRDFFDILTHLDSGIGDKIETISGSMVAMIPSGMALLTSAALASGVVNLATKKVLVQQLYCIEMLARVDMVCFDKTGTLTDGTLKLYKCLPIETAENREIRKAVTSILDGTKDSNATANALKLAFGESSAFSFKAVLPFDSETKVSAVTLETGITYAMGAYGYIKAKPNEKVGRVLSNYASKGYRCLIVAKSKKPITNNTLPGGFELLALLVLSDHIKEDAKANVEWFQSNGVEIKVVSGDDPRTVSEIAKRCGVNGSDLFISLEGKSNAEVEAIANKYVVFGRSNPEQKAILISSFQKQGRKVAMTGDGVNDVMALKVADCSIAMASGSEAARNVAHLVTLESNFSRLPDVVFQGRRVINNLQRTCSLFLNKTFFAVFATLVFLISGLWGGKTYPFSTSNLLLWEVFAIGVPSFFLALQPSADRLSGSFGANIVTKALPSAIANLVGSMAPFFLYLVWPNILSWNPGQQEAFMAATSISIVVFTINAYITLFAVCLPPNKYRLVVFISMLVGGIIVVIVDYFIRTPKGDGILLAVRWNGLSQWFVPIVIGCVAISTIIFYGLRKLIDMVYKMNKKGPGPEFVVAPAIEEEKTEGSEEQK
ncbi:MAG: HAD-IC family P-type ATPase [Bacilli bacterium]|nr:HAD-IC family P-type ATPase [Bacilli bacterium]